MKGDLVNGLAFLSIVPWYCYLAITSSFFIIDTPPLIVKPTPSSSTIQLQGMNTQQQQQQQQQQTSSTVKDIHSPESIRLQQSRLLDEIILDDSGGTPSIIPIRNYHETNHKIILNQKHYLDNASKNSLKMSHSYDDNESEKTHDESILLSQQQSRRLQPSTIRIIHRFMVCIVFHLAGILGFMSWYYSSIKLSVCNCIVGVIAILVMNLFQWPHPNESTLIPQFLWYLMTLSANTPLPLLYQVVLGLLGLAGAIGVMINIPYYDLNDGIPMLLGATGEYFSML